MLDFPEQYLVRRKWEDCPKRKPIWRAFEESLPVEETHTAHKVPMLMLFWVVQHQGKSRAIRKKLPQHQTHPRLKKTSQTITERRLDRQMIHNSKIRNTAQEDFEYKYICSQNGKWYHLGQAKGNISNRTNTNLLISKMEDDNLRTGNDNISNRANSYREESGLSNYNNLVHLFELNQSNFDEQHDPTGNLRNSKYLCT